MFQTKKAILAANLQSGDVKLEHYKEHIFTLLPHFTEDQIFKMFGIRPPYNKYYNEFKEKPWSLFLLATNTKFNRPFGFMYIIIENDDEKKIQMHGGSWGNSIQVQRDIINSFNIINYCINDINLYVNNAIATFKLKI